MHSWKRCRKREPGAPKRHIEEKVAFHSYWQVAGTLMIGVAQMGLLAGTKLDISEGFVSSSGALFGLARV